jgi:lysophospholipase L1-like esterase/peptidoglycan/xylan/chitin deacetylase (PgdA/CDA1 family)
MRAAWRGRVRRTTMVTGGTLLLAGMAVAGWAQGPHWVPAWGSAQMVAAQAETDKLAALGPVTVRQIVHLSGGGTMVRVRLSNSAGTAPLRVDAAALGKGAPASATVSDNARLTFSGAPAVTIPAGAEAYSDPLPLATHAGDDLTISLFFPDAPATRTGHPGARATTFAVRGDQTAAATLTGPQTIGGWWSLADVEVSGGGTTGTIVAIGDSITDGRGVRDDANTRWPDEFARRLSANRATAGLSVVNAGIGGNRVLLDGAGPNLLARFDRDVIDRPNTRAAIVLEGVNDLGTLTRDQPVDAATHRAMVAAITAAYRQLAARAHAHGIRLIGGTITPLVGNANYHAGPETEADRQAINRFIRTSGTFDAVVDFDAAVRDPAHPDRLLPAYDTGDHLHPNEAGYRAMAQAIPLSLFAERRILGAAAPITVGPRPPSPQIALTYDDLPAHGPLPIGDDRLHIAQRIIAALKAERAPAFGFYNGGFASDATAPQVVAAWRRAGLPIGNHSWSHGNLATTTAPAFLADVARNEPALAAAGKGSDWRWFRYPFLSEGEDMAQVGAVRAGLRAKGYRIAAVTMSFGDYGWNDAYARCVAKNDAAAITSLETSFLAAARTQALRSRALSQAALGRDIPYVLLMHLGAFDARMMPRLLAQYREMGFTFTTLQRAEADPFYAAATDLALPGPSPTLEAAATAKGVPIPADTPLPPATLCT